MEETEYRSELRKILDENSAAALSHLNTALQAIPTKAQSIELIIFPDQDREGTFSLSVSLSGPDLHILNKAIADSADIISVKYTDRGLEPKVLLMDPFNSDFEVNDVLADVVDNWLKTIWSQADTSTVNVPVTIVADEGYSTSLPVKLN